MKTTAIDTNSADRLLLPPRGDRDRHGARGHQHQHAGRIGAGLRIDVGAEHDRDEDADAGEDHDQRPGGARPLGRHAVARQIERHQVQQAGQRRRAGEPQNGDGHQVVDRAEAGAEKLVREIGERPAVGRAAGLKGLGGNQQHRDDAAGHQQHAHDQRRRRQQLLGVPDSSRGVLFGVGRDRRGPAASPRRRSRIPTARAPAWETG